jgi:hypothetical protein
VSVFGVHVKVADDVDGALSVSVTVTVLVLPPPVTVIMALLVPTVAVALFTLTVMAPAFAPDVGVIASHVAFLLTVHVPLELTITDWFAGFAAPCVAVNERLVGVTVNEGAETVSVTVAVLVIPPPVTVMVALLVPATAVAKFTLAVRVPLPDPEAGLTVSHEPLLLAVHVSFEVTVTD